MRALSQFNTTVKSAGWAVPPLAVAVICNAMLPRTIWLMAEEEDGIVLLSPEYVAEIL
jgi:hypothetical protein